MVKILIFIGLKIAEILGVCGIVGILYGIGWLLTYQLGIDPDMTGGWLCFKGFFCLAFLVIIFVIGFGIYCAIKANWAWADRLSKKRGE